MAFDFKKLYNDAVAKPATSLNRGINQAIGKDVFKDVKTIEEPKTFAPLSSFEAYSEPEPAQWTLLNGSKKTFSFEGNEINISENLDRCMQYVPLFKSCAEYYSQRFEYRYKQCVTDYDSLLNYFEDMYVEGLKPMISRAYSLLLPFDIFSYSEDKFSEYHINTYGRAIKSYQTMLDIQDQRNQQAANIGNAVGNSVQLQGGGFGVRGAAKGIAQAELFNLAMTGVGKFVAHQSRLSDDEKKKIFEKFNSEIFFKEVYLDYLNTFFSLVQILSENGVLGDVSTRTGDEYNTMINNLKNPMFPQEKVVPLLTQLISKYPFTQNSYEVILERFGETEEYKVIKSYFTV